MSDIAGSSRWRLRRHQGAVRMERLRALGSETFTWADLLQGPLRAVQVYVLYFPSRFELPVDETAAETLRTFGQHTPTATSVDFWDPRDPSFGAALSLFDLRHPPAIVLATGLRRVGDASRGEQSRISDENLYCISFSDTEILSTPERTASAVNLAHEVLVRCDRREIAAYIRSRRAAALLRLVGRGAGAVRDELVRLNPRFGLPGGISIAVGGSTN
ncbi:hypothetical protein [Streptomyces phaeochromogenes]|uniref:hypothetical protein n=1 Tax=Streptomyces phaeochromogenes TaxID=1923 RepID=UPI002DDA8919|nr:hypothetical protein [Streptomyces phaeochromogenes]WRZ26293.1 hypothetical protein OG931_00280 [Streptomyces phaeochromogenes]